MKLLRNDQYGLSAIDSSKQNKLSDDQKRQRNNKSPLQGMGASSMNKNMRNVNKNKFESAAARYQ